MAPVLWSARGGARRLGKRTAARGAIGRECEADVGWLRRRAGGGGRPGRRSGARAASGGARRRPAPAGRAQSWRWRRGRARCPIGRRAMAPASSRRRRVVCRRAPATGSAAAGRRGRRRARARGARALRRGVRRRVRARGPRRARARRSGPRTAVVPGGMWLALVVGGQMPEVLLELLRRQRVAAAGALEDRLDAGVGAQDQAPVLQALVDEVLAVDVAGEGDVGHAVLLHGRSFARASASARW